MTNTLLIAVHVQRKFYFRDTNGPMAVQYNEYVGQIADRIQAFSLHPSLTTLWVLKTDYCGPSSGEPFQIEASEDMAKIVTRPGDELYCVTPKPGDFVMNTRDGSAFGSPLLKPFLREKNFGRIGIVGSYAPGCASGTLEDACRLFPTTMPTMLTDMVGTPEVSRHEEYIGVVQQEMEWRKLPGQLMKGAAFLESLKEKPAPPAKATPVPQAYKAVA